MANPKRTHFLIYTDIAASQKKDPCILSVLSVLSAFDCTEIKNPRFFRRRVRNDAPLEAETWRDKYKCYFYISLVES